jgi:hypothetical protein
MGERIATGEAAVRHFTQLTTIKASRLMKRFRTNELSLVLEKVVQIGLRNSWTELQGTPLRVPQIQLRPEPPEPDRPASDEPTSMTSSDTDPSVSRPVNKKGGT